MKLSVFIPKLERLASGEIMRSLQEKVGRDGLKLIDDGFANERDPYGKQWAYVKYHAGHSSVLDDSGYLRSSFRTTPIPGGVRFSSDCVYAHRQNYARNMLPITSKGLPVAWHEMVYRDFAQSVKETMNYRASA